MEKPFLLHETRGAADWPLICSCLPVVEQTDERIHYLGLCPEVGTISSRICEPTTIFLAPANKHPCLEAIGHPETARQS